MIGLEIMVRIYPQKRTEFLQVFDMSQGFDFSYDKRVSMHLFERVNEANTFLWREEWENNESLMLYCKENRFRATMGAIGILGELIHHKHFLFEEELVDG